MAKNKMFKVPQNKSALRIIRPEDVSIESSVGYEEELENGSE